MDDSNDGIPFVLLERSEGASVVKDVFGSLLWPDDDSAVSLSGSGTARAWSAGLESFLPPRKPFHRGCFPFDSDGAMLMTRMGAKDTISNKLYGFNSNRSSSSHWNRVER